MLNLTRKPNRDTFPLLLGGEASLVMRRAQSHEVAAAEAEARLSLAQIAKSGEALLIFCPDLAIGEDISDERFASMEQQVVAAHLAMRVVSEVKGLAIEKVPQTAPSLPLFALLFQEPRTLQAFIVSAYASHHERTLQGNGSAPSPIGEGKAAPPSAELAESSNRPAPMDNAARMESSAPSESMES